MSWLKKLLPTVGFDIESSKRVPEGVWLKCTACDATLYRSEVERCSFVCPKCDHHMRLSAGQRLASFLDPEEQVRIAEDVEPVDRLKFRDSKKYKDRLSAAQKKSGEKEAVLVVKGYLNQQAVVVAAFDFNFIGGSMGAAVGERFVQGVQAAIEANIPFVCFATSGGARMQEGLLSLLQMAKTSAVLTRLASKRLPFISILTDPTMGGVTASFAMLGDVILAEPRALIGFAGPRVIAQTIRETLPEGFQRSEFLLEHGAIDAVVHRHQLRDRVSGILSKLMAEPRLG